MSKGKWVFVVATLLVTTNMITYGIAFFRCQDEKLAMQREIDRLQGEVAKVRALHDQTQKELKKLKVWENFINIQHRLNAINEAINALNYGIAIDHLKELQKSIREGRLGEAFARNQEELVGILQACIDGLKAKDERARIQLVKFNERLFQILAGMSPLKPAEQPGASPSEEKSESPPTQPESDRF